MERKKDTILDLDIWRNPQRATNKGNIVSTFWDDLTILIMFPTIRFHSYY